MYQTLIWFHLLAGPRRFSELQRLIPQASRQMLTIQVRQLEHMGVVRREVSPEPPPKVEYSLTALGSASEPTLRRFVAWGEWFCAQADLDYSTWLVDLGGKWTVWIWFKLLDGAKRFGELQRLLPRISRQSLALELRRLERMGVARRQVTSDGPHRSVYALTDAARRSQPILIEMLTWGKEFTKQTGLAFDWPA